MSTWAGNIKLNMHGTPRIIKRMSNPPAYSKNSDTKFSYPTPSPVSYSVPYSQPPASPTLEYSPANGGSGYQPQNGGQVRNTVFNPHMMPIHPASDLKRLSESTFTTCPKCNYTGFSIVEHRISCCSIIVAIILFIVAVNINPNLALPISVVLILLGIVILLCAESRHHVCSKCKESMASKFTFRACCC